MSSKLTQFWRISKQGPQYFLLTDFHEEKDDLWHCDYEALFHICSEVNNKKTFKIGATHCLDAEKHLAIRKVSQYFWLEKIGVLVARKFVGKFERGVIHHSEFYLKFLYAALMCTGKRFSKHKKSDMHFESS